ncbi:MAG: NAD(P)/FAD-dependent oxidoreductase [Acidimicrobiia bacterium]|nr:NAD(P)/FAD-dependent oxidoreductase [Acidimicrobiia bacterium]
MEDRFDVIIVGGGHNGTTLAAYLAKSGRSVCVLESRPECGGGQENTEPIPGFRIDPHATYLYGAAAPGFEQLELGRFGYRHVPYRSTAGLVTSAGEAVNLGSRWDPEIATENLMRVAPGSLGTGMLLGSLQGDLATELLRALFWTPPYPAELDVDPMDLPWAKVMDKYFSGMFKPEWLEMSLVELLDELLDYEPLKTLYSFAAWYCGAHPAWEGMALPALGGVLMFGHSSGSPRGGMHTYAHAIIRCALHHGARIVTNSPVERILVENGRAVGVELAEGSSHPGRRIYADDFVVSAVDVQHTFLQLVDGSHTDVSFRRRVSDISLKGGSLYVASVVCRELPRYGDGADAFPIEKYPSCVVVPCDSREANFFAQTEDVYSFNRAPLLEDDHLTMMVCTHDVYDPTRAPEGYHVLSPIYLEMPPPQYDVSGAAGVNRDKAEITDAVLRVLRTHAPNMTDANIEHVFVNTPYDSEFRNAGLTGGNWYAIRQSADQWFSGRPLPELSRYRTPIDDLYLCNQTSHPGGLCLMAVPYNLMHILIEDGKVDPGPWWYPAPWHMPAPAA